MVSGPNQKIIDLTEDSDDGSALQQEHGNAHGNDRAKLKSRSATNSRFSRHGVPGSQRRVSETLKRKIERRERSKSDGSHKKKKPRSQKIIFKKEHSGLLNPCSEVRERSATSQARIEIHTNIETTQRSHLDSTSISNAKTGSSPLNRTEKKESKISKNVESKLKCAAKVPIGFVSIPEIGRSVPCVSKQASNAKNEVSIDMELIHKMKKTTLTNQALTKVTTPPCPVGSEQAQLPAMGDSLEYSAISCEAKQLYITESHSSENKQTMKTDAVRGGSPGSPDGSSHKMEIELTKASVTNSGREPLGFLTETDKKQSLIVDHVICGPPISVWNRASLTQTVLDGLKWLVLLVVTAFFFLYAFDKMQNIRSSPPLN